MDVEGSANQSHGMMRGDGAMCASVGKSSFGGTRRKVERKGKNTPFRGLGGGGVFMAWDVAMTPCVVFGDQ
jgi:hypothetical protein